MNINKNYSNNNINTNKLYIAEDDGLVFDYEEIRAGIERAREDIRCGRYIDGRTFVENLKRKFCDE